MAVNKVINSNGKVSYTVYVNLRSKIIPGVRFQKRLTGVKTKNLAFRMEKKLIQDISIKIANEEGHGFTWRQILSLWTAETAVPSVYNHEYCSVTVKDYLDSLKKWTSDWFDTPASLLNRGDGREVLSNLEKSGLSLSYQKKMKSTINLIYNWGIERKYIRNVNVSPVHGIVIRIKQHKRPEILKTDEIRKLLYEAKRYNHDWYYIWAMALMTGMRNGELYALRWSDIDLSRSMINVERSYNFQGKFFKETKAGYWRTVPISDELRKLILEIKLISKEEYVLPRLKSWKQRSQTVILKKFCQGIKIPPIKFHTLRACFATQLIGLGVEPIKVMKICGWKDLKTLSIYLRLSGVDENGSTDLLNLIPKQDGRSLYSII